MYKQQTLNKIVLVCALSLVAVCINWNCPVLSDPEPYILSYQWVNFFHGPYKKALSIYKSYIHDLDQLMIFFFINKSFFVFWISFDLPVLLLIFLQCWEWTRRETDRGWSRGQCLGLHGWVFLNSIANLQFFQSWPLVTNRSIPVFVLVYASTSALLDDKWYISLFSYSH